MKKYYIDEFVNYTAPTNGRCIDMSAEVSTDDPEVLFDEIPSEFAARFEWDTRIDGLGPIMLWENKGLPVAYWDCEYCCGYFV